MFISKSEKKKFARQGLLSIKGFFNKDKIFANYLADLIWSVETLLKKQRDPRTNETNIKSLGIHLENTLLSLNKINPDLGRHIHALTSHPGKLLSQNLLRHHPKIIELVSILFGKNSVLAFPQMSDSLGMFFPAKADIKLTYDQKLPVHQDFPYMMQSCKQLVLWIPLTTFAPSVGSIEYWPGSNINKTVRQKQLGDYFEVFDEELIQYENSSGIKPVKLNWELGDLVMFDSNIFHRTVQNKTTDRCRITQIFRISDLNDDDGLEYNWRSTNYIDRNSKNPKSVSFQEFYPKLVVKE